MSRVNWANVLVWGILIGFVLVMWALVGIGLMAVASAR